MTYSRPLPTAYQNQQILNASPAEQVVMLYDGAIKFCLKAKEAIAAGNIQERHNNNRRAMEVVGYLLDILDIEKGGDVARRLQMIYSFLLRRLLEVDFKNDPRICDEVLNHLRLLRTSWEKIAQNETSKKASSAGNASGAYGTSSGSGSSDDPAPPRVTSAVA